MAEDRLPETGIPETDDRILAKEDGGAPQSVPSSASPPKTLQQDVLLHGVQAPNADHNDNQGVPIQGGGSFVGEVAVRETPHYAAQMLPHAMHSEQHFIQGGSLQHPSEAMSMHHDLVPSPQDGQRRASLYGSPAEYSNAPSAAAVYTPTWHQQHAGTTAPDATSMYSFTPHPPATTQGHFGGHPNVPVAQSQYLGPQYDGLARGNFDQAALFRHASGANPPQHVQGSQGFPAYLSPDGRSMSNWNAGDAKAEAMARATNSHHGQYP